MNLLFSNIVLIFVMSDQSLGSEMAQNVQGFFICPNQYCGGLVFVPVTGDPKEGSDSGNGHRFYLVAVKNFLIMKNNSIGVSTPQQIIEDLVTTDEASRMRDHLREMLDAYLLSEDDSRCRHEVYGTYLAIDRLIRRVELMEEKRVA